MTAHATARKIRAPLGLAVDATYRAALFVAHENNLIDPRGVRTVYDLSPIEKAETILAACAAGGGLTKALDGFLARARATGLVARLAELLADRERLADSEFVFDAEGRARRIFVLDRALSEACLEVELFPGGSPTGRTFMLSGVVLAEALD